MEGSRALLIAIIVLSIVGVGIAAVAVSPRGGVRQPAQQASEESPKTIKNHNFLEPMRTIISRAQA